VTGWLGVLATCVGCYLQKLAGLLVPPSVLAARPRLARATQRLPAALLAALVVTAAFAAGPTLVLDARLAGVVTAVVLLAVRAPLLLVVVGAAAITAVARAAGG